MRQQASSSVMFVADRVTMRSADRAFLACDVWAEEEDLDPKYYQELIDSPPRREFRTAPAAVHDVHANLSIANVDFEEIAQAAFDDPEGVLSGWSTVPLVGVRCGQVVGTGFGPVSIRCSSVHATP
ncbi:hypothetical protein OG315_41205 [Streptomyces atratus]|nr:hypothetical protein [Streptomyces atratus]MCX5346059.1 hypothetical protein [Streptomyces atratus]